MFKRYLLITTLTIFVGCSKSEDLRGRDTQNPTAYIPAQCYTKTERKYNPCYSCHTKGVKPNYIDDSELQESYSFQVVSAYRNSWKNLFKDREEEIAKISDSEIIKYISENNYIKNGKITLAQKLKSPPKIWDFNQDKKWSGYTPDCYFNFDSEGFDRDFRGNYTGWRAFAYYPFLGTFFPTNGSRDDVLIRLPKEFMQDDNREFNLEIYKINLAIVESLIKGEDIEIDRVDEKLYRVDLNRDGVLNWASKVIFDWAPLEGKTLSYVGLAKFREDLAKGLYPKGTEFLHSLRYIGEDLSLTPRMKELRYAKKIKWKSYADLEIFAINLAKETQEESSSASLKVGNIENGLQNGIGWIYQGFIEDRDGELRAQTYEETLYCIGCHSTIGATVDSAFAFQRRYGWHHWSQKDFKGVKDRVLKNGKGEYSFYLENNRAGDEFRANREVIDKFFYRDETKREEAFQKLRDDISYLLLPSKERALELNKAYKTIVDKQSFIYGRDAVIEPLKNIYSKVKEAQRTGVDIILVD